VLAVGATIALTGASDSSAQEPLSVKLPVSGDANVTATLDGVPGAIDVTSFDVEVKNTAADGAGGAGKAAFGPVRFGKNVDASSPLLLKAVATGQHLRSATFTFTRPGNRGATFETYKLEDVTVSGFEQGPAQPAAETAELTCAQITVTETPAGGAPVTFGWDTKTNTPVP
jgi:type VI secretion system Hcp family effector